MLFAGALESATVGLLVPLLSTLTSTEQAPGPLERWLPFLGDLERGQRVLALSIGILGIVVVKNLVGYAAVRVAGHLRRGMLVELRRLLLDRLLRAPMSIIENKTTGEISGAFLVEAGRANRALDYALTLAQRGIVAGGYAVAITLISLRLTAATLLLGVLLGFASVVLSRRSLRIGRDLVSSNAALGREVSESVGGLRVVRATAGQSARHASFARANEAHADADIAASVATQRAQATTETLGVAGAMGLTAAAYGMWISTGVVGLSHFLAFGFGLLRLLPALNQLYGMHTAVTSFAGSMEKVLGWLDLPSFPERPFGSRTDVTVREGVTFEGVSYLYPNGHPALRDVSFSILAGETVAILGPSGSGKTTLASLLLRLREPTRGAIRFDGVDYWDFAPESFHRGVAFVEQEPFMFNGSIAENIAYGAPWVGTAEVRDALSRVHMDEVIDRLPQGLDTILGERGATLSGGQRQRLAIARAIVRNPSLLILDEPTSALDAVTEQEVMAAIEAASAQRTTIIITHRLSTVSKAHRVVKLSAGAVEGVTVRDGERHAEAV